MFGAYPFASVPFAASLTDASTVPAVQDLIADQESPRAYLFHAKPYDPVSAAEADVRASIGLQYPIVDSVHWPAFLKTACDSQVELFGEDEDAQGRTSFGNLELMIGDGEHDDILGLLWDGREVEVMLGAEGFDIDEYVTVLKGTSEDITYDQRRLSIVFRGKEELLNKPVQESLYAGTGGLEGDESLIGNEKPICFGNVFNITPVLVDETNQVYQFHDGAAFAVVGAYDGGGALTSHGDVADITAASVPAGYFKTQLSGGYIKLGAPPEKMLTIDAQGSSSGGYITNWSDVVKRIILDYTDLTEADLNLPSFFTAKLDSGRSVIGLYIIGQSVSDVLSELAHSVGGSWTFNRLGLLTLGVFRKRLSAGTITSNDITKGSFRRERTPAPSWQRRIGYRRAWTVATEDQFIGDALAGRKSYTVKEFRYSIDEDATIKTSRAGARIVEKNTLLVHIAEADTEAARQQALFGANRDRVNLVARRQQFKYSVGQTITVDYERFDFPKDMIILGIRENTSLGQTTFRLWG